MKLYRTTDGIFVDADEKWYRLVRSDWTALTCRDDMPAYLRSLIDRMSATEPPGASTILPPVENQEVWAAGVTYYRSRTARMEEAEAAGGGTFYDRVYEAERPELFLKATPHRVVGS